MPLQDLSVGSTASRRSSSGLGSRTSEPKQEKTSWWDNFKASFSSSGGDDSSMSNPEDPSDRLPVVDFGDDDSVSADIYDQPEFTYEPEVYAAVTDAGKANVFYTPDDILQEAYDADMAGKGEDKPDPLGNMGVPGVTLKDVTDTDEGALSNPDPLYKMAEEVRTPTISTTALDDEGKPLVDFNKITNIQDVRSDSALEGVTGAENLDEAIAAALGEEVVDVSPSAEAPEQQGLMSRQSFKEAQPKDSRLGGLFNIIPDAFQVSNWLTGGNQLDGTQGEGASDTEAPSTELGPEQGPELYPANERSVITYARDIYPDNPKAAAALAATIQFEGMKDAEEDVSKYSWKNITSSSSTAGWLKKSITDSNKPWAKKRTNKLYQLYGGKPKTDADGNTIPLTREPTKEELKAVQTKLKERGFYKGAIDGVFGRGSKAALKKFQGIENSKLETMSGDYPEMPENGELDRYTAKFFDLELRLKDHEGNSMIEYERPTKPVVPAGEKVVDITYNPYYRANGYSDQLGDVPKEGLEGNTPEAGTFRGRGPVQVTNKAMYEKLRDTVLSETGVDIMKNPSAVANDLNVSKAATVAFLNEVGFDKLSPKQALKVINPQMPSSKLNKRLEAYEKYLKEMQE